MNSILKYTALVLLCGLFLLPSLSNAQEKSDPKKQETPKAQTDVSNSDETEFEFPDVEGWTKSVKRYDPSTGLGEMANYDSEEGGRVTVYYYTGGRELIPNDLTSNILKEEMTNAKIGILQLGEMGVYQNIKEAKNDTVTVGGKAGKIKALHSLLYFTAGENDLVSEIFIFPYKNNFVKIRASRPKEKEKNNKTFEAFLSEIDTYFSK